MDIEELMDTIKDCAKEVRKYLTPGFEENVYKNALYFELKDHGLEVQTEVPIKVVYEGTGSWPLSCRHDYRGPCHC